jgi:hypothetical protein
MRDQTDVTCLNSGIPEKDSQTVLLSEESIKLLMKASADWLAHGDHSKAHLFPSAFRLVARQLTKCEAALAALHAEDLSRSQPPQEHGKPQ